MERFWNEQRRRSIFTTIARFQHGRTSSEPDSSGHRESRGTRCSSQSVRRAPHFSSCVEGLPKNARLMEENTISSHAQSTEPKSFNSSDSTLEPFIETESKSPDRGDDGRPENAIWAVEDLWTTDDSDRWSGSRGGARRGSGGGTASSCEPNWTLPILTRDEGMRK